MIRAESETGKGRAVSHLPARPRRRGAGEGSGPDNAPALGGTETVLLAEDEEAIRRLTIRTLEAAGYHVLVAQDGEEAVSLFTAHAEEVALAIIDVVMPRVGGREAAQRMRGMKPGLPVLFASGYGAEAAVTRAALSLPGTALVQKPFNLNGLLRMVRRGIEESGAEVPGGETRRRARLDSGPASGEDGINRA